MIIKKWFIYIQLFFLFLSLTGCQWMVLNRKNKYPDPTPSERQMYVDNHPDMSKEIKISILRGGDLKLGMTKEQVVAAWGLPDEKKRENNKFYDELWLYYPHWKFVNKVYFKGSILIQKYP